MTRWSRFFSTEPLLMLQNTSCTDFQIKTLHVCFALFLNEALTVKQEVL